MKPLVLILICGLLVYLGFFLSKKYNENFVKNSIESTAIITDIIRSNSLEDLVNDDNVLNYIIEYSFTVNGNTIKSFNEIDFDTYNNYFNHELKIGDTINILYHKEKPTNSQIKKLKN